MAACNACGTTILFGGTTLGEARYCNGRCAQRGQLLSISRRIPPDVVVNSVSKVFRGACPKCQGPGPVDVHISYRVWSALLMTRWQSFQHVSCRSCGVKAQLGDALFSLVLGWWGFPWGLIMTPVQITRNIAGAIKNESEMGPSPELENVVRISLAASAVNQPQAPPPR
jgi:hypothetical protein